MLIQSNHTCEVAGDLSVREFTIAASPKMFKILSDQLYSDKELAIVRELVSNAWDAHVAGNNTRTPIQIHLPTVVEPWFEVKDFGTGLSHDDIHNLYTTYGASNKTNSNDLIGGFGLGSKSPLAYTDQFTVESRFKNERRTYQVFIQQTGAPAVTLLDTEFYVGPAGMTINVPVGANAAFTNFEMALAKLLPHIATTPLVNKSDDWVATQMYGARDAIIEFTDDSIHPLIKGYRVLHTGNSRISFIQGITPYNNLTEFWGFARERMDRKDWDMLDRLYLQIDIQIGALEVTASREALSWNEATKSKAVSIVTAVIQHARAELSKKIESATDWFTWTQSLTSLGVSYNHNPLDITVADDKVRALPFYDLLHNYTEVTDAWKLKPDAFGGDFHARGYINYRSYHTARLKNPKLSESKYMSSTDDYLHMMHFVRAITDSVGRYDINKAVILVSDSLNRPWRKHVRQLFDNKQYDYMIVAHGTLSTVRAAVSKLGLPIDVEELKAVKTARSASTAGSRANAAINELSDSVKEFFSTTLYKTVDDEGKVSYQRSSNQMTLKKYVDKAESQNMAIVLVSTGENRSHPEEKFERFIDHYAIAGLEAGYFSMPWDGVQVIGINETYSRLRNMVREAYEDTITIDEFNELIERNEDAMLDGHLGHLAIGDQRVCNFAIADNFDSFNNTQVSDYRSNLSKHFATAASRFLIGLTRLSPQEVKYLLQIKQAVNDITEISDNYSVTTGLEAECLSYLGMSDEMKTFLHEVAERWGSLRLERLPMLFKSMEYNAPRLYRLWRAVFTPLHDIATTYHRPTIKELTTIDDIIHIYNGASHS